MNALPPISHVAVLICVIMECIGMLIRLSTSQSHTQCQLPPHLVSITHRITSLIPAFVGSMGSTTSQDLHLNVVLATNTRRVIEDNGKARLSGYRWKTIWSQMPAGWMFPARISKFRDGLRCDLAPGQDFPRIQMHERNV